MSNSPKPPIARLSSRVGVTYNERVAEQLGYGPNPYTGKWPPQAIEGEY